MPSTSTGTPQHGSLAFPAPSYLFSQRRGRLDGQDAGFGRLQGAGPM